MMPSTLPEVEPPDEKTILRLAYQSMQEEYNRIESFLAQKSTSSPGSKLGEYIQLIKVLLASEISNIEGYLNDLGKTNTIEEVENAWVAYKKLKKDLIPHLSKDLLALIGGAYLMDEKLDVMQPSDTHGLPNQSFSELATAMIKELTQEMESILIVGEEDWNYGGSEIIRLRFPACDIWYLPLTVHEYFYLQAQSKKRSHDLLKFELGNLDKEINPFQKDWKKPANEACYLPEIRQLWKDYETIKADPQKWEEYLQALTNDPKIWAAFQERVKDLILLQRAYFCRLFADAFATYYIGPAYIHALLNLEFMPVDYYQLPPQKPSIQERFVIALEILRWMNEKLTGDVKDDPSCFARELGEKIKADGSAAGTAGAEGFMHLWRLALDSAGIPDDPYEEIKSRFSKWITLFEDILRDKAFFKAWKSTHDNWKASQEIEAALLQPDLKLDKIPSHWAVVNAAWTARWLYPSFETFIHDNALWLLNLHDEKREWYEAPQVAEVRREVKPGKLDQAAGWDRQKAIEGITAHIANYIVGKNFSSAENPILIWSNMLAANKITEDARILVALVGNPKLLEDYQKLIAGN